MKTIFFKIALPAFAFMFAIMASLAFTSVENDIAEDCPITKAWIHHGPDEMCILVDPVNCDTVNQDLGLCTVTILKKTEQLYGKDYNASCANIILYKCVP
ncbi:DUF6520 family protein [Flavivirga sp. 57AJ16]|uniref:DUF6520 family protein n=1 Tax=Flavivirga sp. 57AJ16 TaxID=3025307 RepID=UPI002366A0B5|nr:DUF6520 family protein [Flavivirga sp. 57AJ16]MDD7888258.1 DUF6520 family protein [Flavivirga sp. 57AJ16]